ncbi:MAG: ATP-binding protein [Spirochaetaceae bacterium]|nr:MAG: ATP-binding protein [Spirochaetaceae bacterium]
MERIYDELIRNHLAEHRQIALLAGPRQVGKTTTARQAAGDHRYYTWDRQTDRAVILRGPDAVAAQLGLAELREAPRHVIFDELHKYRSWRTFLKGFFDVYEASTRTVVTGSARLGFFRRGGDSLMGRYFLYRMHPISLGELACTLPPHSALREPRRVDAASIASLIRFGGYPEPFLKSDTRFYNRWRRLRSELLFREDLRDLTLIQDVGQVEVLGRLLANLAGGVLNYSNLASDLNSSVDSARRWTAALEALYYCYTIRPWFRNIPKSLRRQPKVYLWDWSMVDRSGPRAENFVASHLLKAVHWWTDVGIGTFDLFYLRDKAKREVDFVVTRDGKPWFLVEVKSSTGPLSPSLEYFQRETGSLHAFQVVMDREYVDADCFATDRPTIVPASTFLSQLV